MDHGCKHKGQGVGAQRQAFAVLDHDPAFLGNGIRTEELLHIQEGLGVAHHLHLRIQLCQMRNVGTVIRLHVGDHQIIRLFACQRLVEVLQPCIGGTAVHGIKDGDLVVKDHIGIVAHTRRNGVLTLEQINGGVVHADAQYGVADLRYAHRQIPFLFFVVESV